MRLEPAGFDLWALRAHTTPRHTTRQDTTGYNVTGYDMTRQDQRCVHSHHEAPRPIAVGALHRSRCLHATRSLCHLPPVGYRNKRVNTSAGCGAREGGDGSMGAARASEAAVPAATTAPSVPRGRRPSPGQRRRARRPGRPVMATAGEALGSPGGDGAGRGAEGGGRRAEGGEGGRGFLERA